MRIEPTEKLTASKSAPAAGPNRPLFVDLDGTLIRTDLLWEALCLLVRRHPLSALALPAWLFAGKARFKARIAERVAPDPALLPYRPEVLDYLRAERARGRRVILASASPEAWVQGVAAHLDLFDDVIASSGAHNQAGAAKLDSIVESADGGDFEYLGNASVDIPIWEGAESVGLVAPMSGARRWANTRGVEASFSVAPDKLAPAILRAMRPHQWAKNALLFIPILLAHEVADAARLVHVLLAFAGFCAAASTGYILNDLIDIESDRQHPTKCRRPLASGTLPVPVALFLMALLTGLGFGTSLAFLSLASTAMLGCYLVLTLAYSFYFKQRLLLDVLILAGLYTHRVLAGGVAADVVVSPWLLAFSAFFFLSLALVKRYVELRGVEGGEQASMHGRAYEVDDWPLVEGMGLACAFISVLILCLFVSSPGVSNLYKTPEILWLVGPVMLYWISRVWFLAHRGILDADPVLFATRDRTSYVCGLLMCAVVVAAAW
jgi:4-hydroxybenzoate polyprenyltransferase